MYKKIGGFKFLKRVITLVLAVCMILSASIPTMAATGFYDAGASSPNIVIAGRGNLWGQPGYWDLRNNANIPDGATVTSLYVYWTSQYPNTGLDVGFFKEDGWGWRVYSGSNVKGAIGQPVKQRWEIRCNAQVNTWIGLH